MTLEAAKKSGSSGLHLMGITEVSMGMGRGGCEEETAWSRKPFQEGWLYWRKERPNAGVGLREEKGYVLNVWTFSSIDGDNITKPHQ